MPAVSRDRGTACPEDVAVWFKDMQAPRKASLAGEVGQDHARAWGQRAEASGARTEETGSHSPLTLPITAPECHPPPCHLSASASRLQTWLPTRLPHKHPSAPKPVYGMPLGHHPLGLSRGLAPLDSALLVPPLPVRMLATTRQSH